MSYRKNEEFTAHSNVIGQCEISIISSIRCFSRADFPLEIIVGFQQIIKLIEMNLYSLMAGITQVSVNTEEKTFNDLEVNLETFKNILKVSKAMLEITNLKP